MEGVNYSSAFQIGIPVHSKGVFSGGINCGGFSSAVLVETGCQLGGGAGGEWLFNWLVGIGLVNEVFSLLLYARDVVLGCIA